MWSHHRERFRLGPHAIKILNLPTSDNGPFVLNALCLSNRGLLVEILQFSRQAHFSVAGSIGRQPISLVKLLFCIFRFCTIFLFCDSETILTSHLGKKTLIGKTMWGKQRVANRTFEIQYAPQLQVAMFWRVTWCFVYAASLCPYFLLSQIPWARYSVQ